MVILKKKRGTKKFQKNKNMAIVVVGMHRSGTSVTTGAMHLSGIKCAGNLLKSDPNNKKGYFEDIDILKINSDFIQSAGLDYTGISGISNFITEYNENSLERQKFREDIRVVLHQNYLDQNDKLGFFIVKDPRISLLWEDYISVFEELGVGYKFLVVNRDVGEIIESLIKRNNYKETDIINAIDVYYKSIENLIKRLDSKREQLSRAENLYATVEYDSLLQYKSDYISLILNYLSLPIFLDTKKKKNIDSFIDIQLKNNYIRKVASHIEKSYLYAQNKDIKNVLSEYQKKLQYVERSIFWKISRYSNLIVYKIINESSFLKQITMFLIGYIQDLLNSFFPDLLFSVAKSLKDKKIFLLNKKIIDDRPTFLDIENDKNDYKDIDILFINHQESRTGAPKILFEIAKEAKKKYKIKIVSLENGSMSDDFRDEFGSIIYPSTYKASRKSTVEKDIINKIKPKLVYGNSIGTFRFVETAKSLDIKTIFHVHELAIAFDSVFNFTQKINFKNMADVFIAVSDPVENLLIDKMGCKKESVIKVSEFSSKKESIEKTQNIPEKLVKEEMNIKEGDIVIMAVGEFIYRKGNDIFLLLAREISKIRKNVKFFWIGKIVPNNTYLPNFMPNPESFRDSCFLLDERRNPYPYMKQAHIMLLPSREDPFPLVVLEGMSLGVVPVVFKDSGGIYEAVGDGGEVIENFDIQKMKESVLDLIDNKEKLSIMSKSAISRQRIYDREVVMPKIVNVLDLLIKKIV